MNIINHHRRSHTTEPPDIAGLMDQLNRIEEKLDALIQQRQAKDFYSTADVARIVDRSEFTVRQWCRLRRVHAEKRPCGRGRTREWMISHTELKRIQSEGLLALPDRFGHLE